MRRIVELHDTTVTLSEWLLKAIERGEVDQVLALLKLLPEEQRVKYRAIYKQAMEERSAHKDYSLVRSLLHESFK